MARILLIDPDHGDRAALQQALEEAGFGEVMAAPSACFALTMIERNRPDLIVSRAAVPDIDGYELCAIVRGDPATRNVRFLLLAASGDDVPPRAFDAVPDRMLVGEFTVAMIVGEVAGLLSAVSPASPAAAMPAAAAPAAANGLRGSLDVMDLPDLTQAIALGGKTGELVLTLGSGQGAIVFDRGRVVHARFGGLRGEAAFVSLVVEANRDAVGRFCFNPLAPGLSDVPRTLNRSVEQLLLGAATAVDESRAGTGPASARTRTA